MPFPPRPAFAIPLADGRTLTLGQRTLLMAIVNVTPDSFADGGDRFDPDVAIAAALQMAAEGADIIDIGGESTRPGARPVDADEEWRRVGPVLEGLRGRITIPVSIDTYKAVTATRAIDLGATIVNDVSALAFDPDLAGVVARRGVALVLMHNRGRSVDMYRPAEYVDVMAEIVTELRARDRVAREAGVRADRIILDPGLGFGKKAAHTLAALAGFDALAALGRPLLSGPSRKSFLATGLGDVSAGDRLWGTAAAVAASVFQGAHIVRVHDVPAMLDVIRVADAIRLAGRNETASVP